MEIRNYQVGDEQKIIDLFELVFKQKFMLESWYWRFRDNPAGSYMIKLMWEDDLLIGHYAVSPIIMNVGKEKILTAHSLATMTHPAYGGKGIFKTLSKSLYDEAQFKYGCKAIWGYPNTNSHFGFINSLDWRNISVIHTLGISIERIKLSEEHMELHEVTYFSTPEINYISNKLRDFPVYIDRNEAYMNWRFQQKPSVDYRSFIVRENNEIEGILVTKLYPNLKGNYDLNIVECFLDDYSKILDIISEIIKKHGIAIDRITLWKNIFDPEHLILEKLGFVPVLPYTYFGARIHEGMDPIFLDYKSWFISLGDSDVY